MISFSRFQIHELTFRRIGEAVLRRIFDIPNAIAWSAPSGIASENRRKIQGFFNKHIGQRCFIIGNGPSLSKTNLNLLEGEYSFGMNRIYLLFNQMAFRPSYFVCINNLILEQFYREIRQLELPKFLNWDQRKLYRVGDPDTMFVRQRLSIGEYFGRDATRPLSGGGTVTFITLQIAFYMGFQEVILIGVDHNFLTKGTPNTTEVRKSEQDIDHFHPDYFPKGTRWQIPDLRRSELAYTIAREVYQKDGRRIIDATIDGKCPVFEKQDYYSLFER